MQLIDIDKGIDVDAVVYVIEREVKATIYLSIYLSI